MITFPGSPQNILEKFRDQIQNFIDPTGDTWKIMCVSQNVEATSMPNVAYQSAVLCNQFNQRIYEYRDITNRLVKLGQRHTPMEGDVHKVANVFEDMLMLHQEDGLITERHIACYFGAILRAIKKHPMWMQMIDMKVKEGFYGSLHKYFDMDNMHICMDTTCKGPEFHEKLDPNAEVVENPYLPKPEEKKDPEVK